MTHQVLREDHTPRHLALSICPDCGAAQITVPLDDEKRMTVVVNRDDFMQFVDRIMKQIEAYYLKKIDRDNVFLPAKCCNARKCH
jgi:hypothetical protein